MSLAVAHPPRTTTKQSKQAEPKLLTGINSSEQEQLAGKNEHFRVFSVSPSAVEPISKHQLFRPSSKPDIYQRVLRTRGSLAAIATGATGGSANHEVVVVSTRDFTVKKRVACNVEVADLDLAEDGGLVYCTEKEIFVVPPASNASTKLNFQPSPSSAPFSGKLRSLRYLTPKREHLVAVVNAPKRTGAEVFLINANTGSTISRKKLHSGAKAATGLDVVTLSDSGGAMAVAGADQSVELLAVGGARIRHVRLFRQVHPFQISKVAFSPAPPPPPPPSSSASVELEEEDENAQIVRLATTSIGHTVVVYTFPLVRTKGGYKLCSTTKTQTAISVLLSLVAVVVFAAVLQAVFVARGGLTVSDFMERLPKMHAERPAVAESERAADALIAGLKSGAAADPFGEDPVDQDELREDLLNAERKDEL